MACQTGVMIRELQTAELTVAGVVGTGYGVFSFDAPVASFCGAEHGAQLRRVCDSDAG